MTDILYNIDLSVFYFINHGMANPLFDRFFVFITNVDHWFLTYLILLWILFAKGGRKGRIAAFGAVILIALSDQFSSFFMKNLIERVRPCNVLADARVLTGCSGSFSFPSSHAVNNFAMAMFFYRLYPNYKWALFIVAALIAFSRVYVGRHYPSDILGGAILGMAIGYIMSLAAQWVEGYIAIRKKVQVR